jgi:hypothetical protein
LRAGLSHRIPMMNPLQSFLNVSARRRRTLNRGDEERKEMPEHFVTNAKKLSMLITECYQERFLSGSEEIISRIHHPDCILMNQEIIQRSE